MLGYTLKEAFPDINHREIVFMNKALKVFMQDMNLQPMSKRVLSGEKWPSNQWDFRSLPHAIAVLSKFRNPSFMAGSDEDLIDLYIRMPIRKGWSTTYMDGEMNYDILASQIEERLAHG